MNDKNSNRISFVIAVFSILLLLGGVFLLNQSFNETTSDSEERTSLTEKYRVSSSEDDDEDSTNGRFSFNDDENDSEDPAEGSFNVDGLDDTEEVAGDDVVEDTLDDSATDEAATEDEVETDDTTNSETPIETEPAPDPEDTDTTEEQEEEGNEEPVTATNLATNQFTAKVTAISGNAYDLELTGCGIQNPVFCVAGTEITLFSLNNFTDESIEVNNNFLFTGSFSDGNSGMFIGSLSTMEKL